MQRAVETVQKRGNHINVIILDGIHNVVDEDFRCMYQLSPNILNLMEEIKWEHLNSKLLQKATRDSRRNVSSQDIGFCGWRNSAADSDHAGMAFPRLHSGTEHPEVAQTLLVLTQILDEAFPHIARDLYSCP